ncbi:MAG TPA: RAMP superfamily CRISPR-associated protein [Gemmataceae bacterium]|nr:RAMP superfamily CRISPR-associated protein [Gemmataceae bacterium]
MPQGENFWNPYRWVPVSEEKVARAKPAYRHRWQGLSGRLDCTLEALTPFLIGSSKGDGRFIRSGRTNQPFIPGTSLKGLIRSLAELIGNAAIPFPNGRADPGHKLEKAAEGEGVNRRLDIAARMFGYLNRRQVFAGLVRFTDGVLQGTAKEIGPFKVVVGQPRPDSHKPFYPDDRRRKFYHHHVGANGLVPAPSSITQTRTVYPLPPGTRFTFQVHFENLRDEELNLLLYCLVLEENVTVTLSKAALGPDAQAPVTLTGPLRHKFGGCKPQGGGSVQITIDKMTLYADRADRYRGQAATPRVLEGEVLRAELNRRTQPIADRDDDETMRHLRAMLIYCENDPRKPIEYPDYNWFQQDKGTGTPLKPTL